MSTIDILDILRRDFEREKQFELSAEDLDRLNNDPEVMLALSLSEQDDRTPINIATARKLIAAQPREVTREQLREAVSHSDDLVLFESDSGMMLIGMMLELVPVTFVIDDEEDYSSELDFDEDDYDEYEEDDLPVLSVEPSSFMAMPSASMSDEGLQFFAAEQDGTWAVVPDQGFTLEYQLNVRRGKLKISAAIAEIERWVDDHPDADYMSKVRHSSLSDAITDALEMGLIQTDIAAN